MNHREWTTATSALMETRLKSIKSHYKGSFCREMKRFESILTAGHLAVNIMMLML